MAPPKTPDIYVDADACPVKDEIVRVAERHQLQVHLVSNSGMFGYHGHPLVTQTVVSEGADVADDWIAERIGPGDIVVTQDIPLADRCIKRGARALRPDGRVLDTQSIGMALATRDLMTDLRSAGETTRGPRGFTKQDRSNFLQVLEVQVQAARRTHRP
ncbi:MAG: YaiI/YqxD family protein [Alphaproteobacteria bacterium]|nr:YaiI/YqxD family protein [Alphaproteobacteria bacterium]